MSIVEKELKERARQMGYELLFEYDSFGDELVYIDVIPKKSPFDGSLRVDADIVDLLKEYGFEFENLVINTKMAKEFSGAGTFAIFGYRGEKNE